MSPISKGMPHEVQVPLGAWPRAAAISVVMPAGEAAATRSRVSALRRQSRIRKEPVVRDSSTFVGLDAHKESIFVAMLVPGQKPVEWQLRNQPAAVRRLARNLQREAVGTVGCCYEAGRCGYTL